MKQIFDWLREQIVHTAEDVSPNMDKLLVMYNVEKLLNEAEAKWEAECCIWTKPSKEHGFIKNPHTGRIFSNEPSMQNFYCNTCGKPIKISEVE